MTEIGVLTIHVKRAEGLKAMDLNGKSDPYVRVHGLHQVAETAVHPKTLDPNFDETLELYGDKGGFVSQGLVLRVFDRDWGKKDDKMGEVKVELFSLRQSASIDFIEGLSSGCGQLVFSVSFAPLPARMLASGRLRVHLKKALGCGGNTYVKLEVAKQKAKTRTCNEQAWDQTFDFTGLLRALTVRPLELEAKDSKMMKSNVSLGNASVDLAEVAAVGALDFTATLSSSQGTIEGRATWLENESFQGADGGFDEVLAHGALHMRRWKAAKWQLRWFELTQHDLLYYSSQEDAMPRGVLPLECIIAVERAADPKTFTLVVVGDAAKAKAMHGTADGKGRSSTGEPSVGRQGSGGGKSRLELQAVKSLGGAADDARLQSERWVNALRLLTHSASGRASTMAGGGAVGKWFGVPLAAAPARVASEGGWEVPAVLHALWSMLQARPGDDGLESEGIFRLSADATELAAAKAALDGCDDGEKCAAALGGVSGACLAALIKLYFRQLPDDLWASARAAVEAAVKTASGEGDGAAALALVRGLPAAERACVGWLSAVSAAVVVHTTVNRMTMVSMATVLTPGMLRPPPNLIEPMPLLHFCETSVKWVQELFHAAARDGWTADGGGGGGSGGGGEAAAAVGALSLDEERRVEQRPKARNKSVLHSISLGCPTGLEEGPLPAACGHDDNEAQDSRLKALSGLDFYQVGGDDGMLRKHSLEAGARAVAIQNFMEELEEMEGSFDDDGEEGDVVVENRKSVSADL